MSQKQKEPKGPAWLAMKTTITDMDVVNEILRRLTEATGRTCRFACWNDNRAMLEYVPYEPLNTVLFERGIPKTLNHEKFLTPIVDAVADELYSFRLRKENMMSRLTKLNDS